MNNIKKIIVESYEDIQELEQLAKEILKVVSDKNIGLIYELFRNPILFDNLQKNIKFDRYINYIDKIVDSTKYKKLKDFIKNKDLIFYFSEVDFGQVDGEYKKSKNWVRIYAHRDEFYEVLEDYREDILNLNNISILNIYKLMYDIMEESFKSLIVHELQHAYDDFRTNGKFVIHKKTQDYFKNQQSKGNENVESKEEYKNYLNLPHEMWARFSETITNFNKYDWKEDFIYLLKGFRNSFKGYKYLDEKDKKRLIKALYKYYKLKN